MKLSPLLQFKNWPLWVLLQNNVAAKEIAWLLIANSSRAKRKIKHLAVLNRTIKIFFAWQLPLGLKIAVSCNQVQADSKH
jgi:hypothetical protein